MSDQKPNKSEKQEKQLKGPKLDNVVAMPTRCPVESCGKRAEKSDFCAEHFVWFKEGLINRQGEKPKDFDKKFQAFMRKKAA